MIRLVCQFSPGCSTVVLLITVVPQSGCAVMVFVGLVARELLLSATSVGALPADPAAVAPVGFRAPAFAA